MNRPEIDRSSPVSSSFSSLAFSPDRFITGVAFAFFLAILAFFLLYPVVDICRLSFFK